MILLRRQSLIVLVMLFACAAPLAAQGFGTSGLTLLGGLSIPAGNFAQTDGDGAGAAKTGWMAGAEYLISPLPAFSIILSGRYMKNPFDEVVVAKRVASVPSASYSVGSYTGILPMAGVQFSTPSLVGFFANAQAGYMFAKTPAISVTAMGVTASTEAQSGKAFAYGVSAGYDIANILVVGASYIVTKPKFDITETMANSTETRTVEIDMNTIQVYAGIRF